MRLELPKSRHKISRGEAILHLVALTRWAATPEDGEWFFVSVSVATSIEATNHRRARKPPLSELAKRYDDASEGGNGSHRHRDISSKNPSLYPYLKTTSPPCWFQIQDATKPASDLLEGQTHENRSMSREGEKDPPGRTHKSQVRHSHVG